MKGSLQRGVSVKGVFVKESLCKRGVSVKGGLCEREVFVKGVSVKGDGDPLVLTSSGSH